MTNKQIVLIDKLLKKMFIRPETANNFINMIHTEKFSKEEIIDIINKKFKFFNLNFLTKMKNNFNLSNSDVLNIINKNKESISISYIMNIVKNILITFEVNDFIILSKIISKKKFTAFDTEYILKVFNNAYTDEILSILYVVNKDLFISITETEDFYINMFKKNICRLNLDEAILNKYLKENEVRLDILINILISIMNNNILHTDTLIHLIQSTSFENITILIERIVKTQIVNIKIFKEIYDKIKNKRISKSFKIKIIELLIKFQKIDNEPSTNVLYRELINNAIDSLGLTNNIQKIKIHPDRFQIMMINKSNYDKRPDSFLKMTYKIKYTITVSPYADFNIESISYLDSKNIELSDIKDRKLYDKIMKIASKMKFENIYKIFDINNNFICDCNKFEVYKYENDKNYLIYNLLH